jgi:hypothetical protein
MIKFIKVKIIKTKPGKTDILLKFEDREISQEQFRFLKDKLDNFKLYLDPENLLKSETEYDEISKKLFIAMTLRTPDSFIPRDIENVAEKFMDIMNTFQNFYEAQIEIFNKQKKIFSKIE